MSQSSELSVGHTPGPWRFDADLREVNNIRPTAPYEAARRRVAIVLGCDAEYEANARLIAAAPEMYAVLRQFIERVESGDVRSTLTYERAKAALEGIASAEGREP